jgi:hypothetical protein
LPLEKCMWNKNYKGYCFTSICNELMINFKPWRKFTSELGGYQTIWSPICFVMLKQPEIFYGNAMHPIQTKRTIESRK